MESADIQAMARAIQLAKKGWYTARPNPRVGCVIVNGGVVVGEGWHRRAGEAHAEVNALAQAGDRARGATVYVSLEPCNHQGKTPPCSEALIKAGIACLVYGMADPHAAASGGMAQLAAAGITVRGPLLEDAALALNPGFVRRCKSGLPRVTLKMAASLDGRSAMASGESQWITGPAARSDVQRLRAQSCAIVTGVGTVLRDNPSLTVREAELGLEDSEVEAAELVAHQPLRVIVDSKFRSTADLKILQPPGAVMIATALEGRALEDKVLEGAGAEKTGFEGVELCSFPNAEGKVDLYHLLVALGKKECNEVLVEAGSKLAGVFLQEQLVDELVLYMAPKLMGSDAMPMATLGLSAMSEALELDITDVRIVGRDLRLTASLPAPRLSSAKRC